MSDEDEAELIHCCFRTQAACDANPCPQSFAGQMRERDIARHALEHAEHGAWLRGVRVGVAIGAGGILAALAVARLVVLAMEWTR